MLLKALFTIIACVLLPNNGECARILGIFSMPATSHQILYSKLMKGLAEAGHDVTMVSPYPLKDKPKNGTYTDIVLDGLAEEFQVHLGKMQILDQKSSVILHLKNIIEMLSNGTSRLLKHPKLEELVASKPKFDLMISEYFFNDAVHVYSYIFDCPLILLASTGPTVFNNHIVGNPQPASYVPLQMMEMSKDLTFTERAKNLFMGIASYLLLNYVYVPFQERGIQDAFPGAPSVYELRDRVELMFLNSHISINKAVPMVPNMVEIGGYFVDPPKALPKDLQEFMDGAEEGVVYFSLGSNAKSKDMPQARKQMFLNIFERLKQRVIWKFEEDLPNAPSNVLIKSWCPQQDILAHPKMKLFITHGGLLSTTETIYHGVPILAIPIFADQNLNAARAVAGGYALQLSYHDKNFTEANLEYLVNELLINPEYAQNVKLRSKLFHDRPMTPMKTAVYWAEYVIKHRGAPHLKVAGRTFPWYKYFMVDVIGLLVLVIGFLVVILTIAVRRLFGRKQNVKVKAE